MPPELLWVINPKTKQQEAVVPGETRKFDVKVAHHIPVSPGAVPCFLDRWENVYSRLGKFEICSLRPHITV
jgi:hypothetical protein